MEEICVCTKVSRVNSVAPDGDGNITVPVGLQLTYLGSNSSITPVGGVSCTRLVLIAVDTANDTYDSRDYIQIRLYYPEISVSETPEETYKILKAGPNAGYFQWIVPITFDENPANRTINFEITNNGMSMGSSSVKAYLLN